MGDILESLRARLGEGNVQTGADVNPDYTHDEGLTSRSTQPLAVVRPASTEDVSAVLSLAAAQCLPVIARGSGTGLSGAAVPVPGCLLVVFDRMDRILEIDTSNHVAVVQPGVTLAQLDAALEPHGLVYQVFPGEPSASIGGSVATNAGGMRAIRYGTTRHQVLGLEIVLAGGEVLRTGGKFVKSSSGFDLTQLVVGSEGALAFVTEATLRLHPRLPCTATLLAPFGSLPTLAEAVPPLVARGVAPLILEYLDERVMASVTASAGLDLGVPEATRAETRAYLIVVLESTAEPRLDEDVAAVATQLGELGALDVFVLPSQAGTQLIAARERAFYVARSAGADDIVDAVVPRASVPDYMATVARLGAEAGATLAGCGHVGDGNVHLSVFLPDPEARSTLMHAVLRAATEAGGAVSGEHGIGTAKRAYFTALEDPAKLALMARIKAAFDPDGLLGPGRILPPAGEER